MTDLETRLREVHLDEPPLGFDPDEVADRAAKLARKRAAGFAVTVVACAAVVAAFLAGPGPAPAPPAGGPLLPSPAEQARIRQALTDAVTRVLPGLRHLSVGTSPADSVEPAQMSVSAEFVDATGQPGNFQLTVRGPAAGASVVPPDRLCSGSRPEAHCTGVPQPGGAVLVISELAYQGGSGVTVKQDFNGFLYRPDGSTVSVIEGIGYSMTREQLTKVITDPAFELP
ncbi:hypothetical protein AB0C38_41935 [Amycolatopsis sp. NPDC048633]|uniref:hypothetical protein n=1 Tax=Amycolatopsis sp. NPDC048633 TaxID=3157095 RepID=UPI0033C6CC7C